MDLVCNLLQLRGCVILGCIIIVIVTRGGVTVDVYMTEIPLPPPTQCFLLHCENNASLRGGEVRRGDRGKEI